MRFGGSRLTDHPANRRDDLGVRRETSRGLFRKEQRAVRMDFENAAVALDKHDRVQGKSGLLP